MATRATNLGSMSLIQAEKTLAFMSALPAARRILLGCQSMERTVDLIGFLRCLATHQLFSESNEQTAITLQGRTTYRGQLELQRRRERLRACLYGPSSRCDRELVLLRTPFDAGSRPVDPEQDEGGLPDSLWREGPDVGVPVLGAGDNSVGERSPVDGGDELVVLQGKERKGRGGGLEREEMTERCELASFLSSEAIETRMNVPQPECPKARIRLLSLCRSLRRSSSRRRRPLGGGRDGKETVSS